MINWNLFSQWENWVIVFLMVSFGWLALSIFSIFIVDEVEG